MEGHMISRSASVVVALLALLLALPASTRASQADNAVAFDLPAMTLTPNDLTTLGLTGYGRFGNGEFRTLDAYVKRRSEFLNIPAAEVHAAFDEAGWLRGYVTNLARPTEPGNPDSPPVDEVFSVVNEYEDAEGAAAGYEFNQHYDGVTQGHVEILGGTRTVGDASFMTHLLVTNPGDDKPSNQVDLTLRRGRIVASTGLIVFNPEPVATPVPVAPEVIDLIEAMAVRLLERIDRTIAGDSPNLSNRIVRLSDDVGLALSTEGYRRLDGDDPSYYGGYQDDFPGEGAANTAVTAYELNQGIAHPGDPYFVVRILEFVDADGATAYLDEVQSRGLSPAGTPAETVAGAATIGDASLTIAYEAEFEPGQVVAGYAVYVRVEATAFMLLVESAAQAPDLAVVGSLAETQARCIQSDDCPESVGYPAKDATPGP
jgi:hypothetical protein